MDPITIAALASAVVGVMNSSKPSAAAALPTSASTIFGPSMFNNDSSGWLVNSGNAAQQSQTNAAKTGPSLSNTATPVLAGPGAYASGGEPTPSSGLSVTPNGIKASVGGADVSIPWLYIAGGVGVVAVLVLVLRKKHG